MFPCLLHIKKLFSFSTIIPGIKKGLEPRRPLRPVRKERKAVTNQNIQETGVRVLVNLVRAIGVPTREASR